MHYNKSAKKFRQWRLACGFTRAAAAEELSYAIQTIKAVELGLIPISGKLARCCTAISGVCWRSLQHDGCPMLVTVQGAEFNAQTYDRWCRGLYTRMPLEFYVERARLLTLDGELLKEEVMK